MSRNSPKASRPRRARRRAGADLRRLRRDRHEPTPAGQQRRRGADCAGSPPSGAPEREGTVADEGPTRLSQEASLGQRGAPRVGVRRSSLTGASPTGPRALPPAASDTIAPNDHGTRRHRRTAGDLGRLCLGAVAVVLGRSTRALVVDELAALTGGRRVTTRSMVLRPTCSGSGGRGEPRWARSWLAVQGMRHRGCRRQPRCRARRSSPAAR